MFTVRILKRKDAVSIILAVVLGLVVAQFISSVALSLSALLSELINQAPVQGVRQFEWRSGIFDPAIAMVLQILVLEIFLQIVIRTNNLLEKAKEHKKQ